MSTQCNQQFKANVVNLNWIMHEAQQWLYAKPRATAWKAACGFRAKHSNEPETHPIVDSAFNYCYPFDFIRGHMKTLEQLDFDLFGLVLFCSVQLQADWRSLTWTENQWIPFRIVLFSLLGTVCCVVCYIRVLAYYFFLFTSAHQFMLFGCKRMRERPKPGAFLSFCGL